MVIPYSSLLTPGRKRDHMLGDPMSVVVIANLTQRVMIASLFECDKAFSG